MPQNVTHSSLFTVITISRASYMKNCAFRPGLFKRTSHNELKRLQIQCIIQRRHDAEMTGEKIKANRQVLSVTRRAVYK